MATNKQKVEKVRITFKAHPEFILDEKYQQIYLVGNTAELGEWNPENALVVERKDSNVFSKTKTFVKGTEIEFKFLLTPSFEKVEVNQYFSEVENRKLVCDKSQTIDLVIENFKL